MGRTSKVSLSAAEIPGNTTEIKSAGISISGSPSFGSPVYEKIPAAKEAMINAKIILARCDAQSMIPVNFWPPESFSVPSLHQLHILGLR